MNSETLGPIVTSLKSQVSSLEPPLSSKIWRRANTSTRNLAQGERQSIVVGQICQNLFVVRRI
jgi:hypothetical protein